MSREPAGPLPPGLSQALAGRFQLQEHLGRGAMGTVWRAHDAELGRAVALKLLSAAGRGDERRARFAREARAVAALQHPGIVRLHAADSVVGVPFLVLELVEGARTLDRVLPERGLRERVELIAQAARALGHAHARGVVHRDVKPSNLLVDQVGQLKVVDFGVAAVAGDDRLTRTGVVLGTPFYAAPEQLRGAREPGPEVDVWGLGVILYEALTGQLPFAGGTLAELALRVCAGELEPPREHDPGLPPALEAVCLRALALDPTRRYPHGEALAADLEAWLRGAPVSAAGPTARARARRWAPRIGVGVVLLLAAALPLAILLGGPAGRSAAPPPASPPRPAAVPAPAPAATSPVPPPAAPPPEVVHERFQHGTGEARCVWVDAHEAVSWGVDGRLVHWSIPARGAPRELHSFTPCGGQPLFSVGTARRHVLVGGGGDTLGYVNLERSSSMLMPPIFQARSPTCVALCHPPGALHSWWLIGTERQGVWMYEMVSSGQVPDRGQALTSDESPTKQVAISPDGSRGVVVSGDGKERLGKVQLFELSSRRLLFEATFLDMGSALAISPDGRRYAVGTSLGRVLLGRLDEPGPQTELRASGEQPRLFPGAPTLAHYNRPVTGVAFAPDGRRLYSVAEGTPGVSRSELKTWDLEQGTELRCETWREQTHGLSLSPDGTRLIVTLAGGELELRPLGDAGD